MVKLKLNQLKKVICGVCHGNGFIRVATGVTSIDFRDNSQVHQCWECDSEGEYYEVISSDNLIGDVNGDDTVN